MGNSYLETFTPEQQSYVTDRFGAAYVFSIQSNTFGIDDKVGLATGPKQFKQRLLDSCTDLLSLEPPEWQQDILRQILSTVDGSTQYMVEIKTRIDTLWKEDHEYQVKNPKAKRKVPPATEPQKNFLKSLGCKETPKNRLDASKLIEKYKKEKYGK